MGFDAITNFINDWWLTILIFLLLLFLLWLMSRGSTSGQGNRGGSSRSNSPFGSSGDNEGDGWPSETPEEANARAQKKADRMLALIKADSTLGAQLNRYANGKDVGAILSTSSSSDLALAIARQVPDDILLSLEVAASEKEIDLDLASDTKRTPVQYVTSDMEPEPITDLSQLPEIFPEQHLLDEEDFYLALAEGRLVHMQSFENETVRKRAYLLIDISMSMQDRMRSGLPRHVWSRGVAISLLRQATEGDAEYFIRSFSGKPHKLRRATTPEEAAQLIQHVLDEGLSESGTDIGAALKRVTNDIRSLEGDIKMTDVVLISDGQDRDLTTEALLSMLGNDVQLHVASIGTENPTLRQVAKTYRVFD